MAIIPKKLAFYTDSFGDGGQAASGGYGNLPTQFNMALRVKNAIPVPDYDAQQFGGSTLVNMVNGYKANLTATAHEVAWWVNPPTNTQFLNLPQHAAAIQADTVVIHLGFNDLAGSINSGQSAADFQADVAHVAARYLGQLAAQGQRVVIIEPPKLVAADAVAVGLFPTLADANAFVAARAAHDAALRAGFAAGIADINARFPGKAKWLEYHSNGQVTMGPGSTIEGLHPTLAKHSEIAGKVAAGIKSWRGW